MTKFEYQCIQAINDAVVSSGLSPFDFELVEGKKENYWHTKPYQKNPSIELYVYSNEAGYMLNGSEWTIFERPDFPGEQELIQSFVASVLGQITKRSNAL